MIERKARNWRAGARATLLSMVCLAVLGGGCRADPGAADEPQSSGIYERPGRLVPLPDGRNLNLRCSGRGSPTVLLESGFGASSAGWARVQGQLSKVTRVCAYDRAGYGFSDPGPLPRDGAAIARDLDQALAAANERGPYVVVGHSAGGLYARLFAALRVKDVEGLILLDPTVAQIRPPGPRDGLEGLRRRVRRCLAAAEASPQPPPQDPQWAGCVSPRADNHTQGLVGRPQTWTTQLSELDELFGRTSEGVLRTNGLLNYVPVYVITASDTAAAAPKVGYEHPQSVLELQHMQLAGEFLRGWQRTVLSSHLIMIDRPEVVVEATMQMVQAARENRPPDGLPPSETGAAGEQAFPSDSP